MAGRLCGLLPDAAFFILWDNLPKKRMELQRKLYQDCPPDSISLARMTWSAGQN